jgi:hypothetical protein
MGWMMLWWVLYVIWVTSDSDFCVVGLEVEVLSGRGECAWYFGVEVVDVILEVALALVGGEVEGEGLLVAHHLPLLLVEPLPVVLVQEVPVPRLVSQHSEVLEEFEGVDLGYD